MEIRNLTSQDVVIVDESGKLIASYPSEGEATVDYTLHRRGVVDGVIIYHEKYRNITGLPEWQEETLYIVTPQIAEAAKDARTDLLIPNSPVHHAEYTNAYQSLIICNVT